MSPEQRLDDLLTNSGAKFIRRNKHKRPRRVFAENQKTGGLYRKCYKGGFRGEQKANSSPEYNFYRQRPQGVCCNTIGLRFTFILNKTTDLGLPIPTLTRHCQPDVNLYLPCYQRLSSKCKLPLYQAS